MNAPPPSRATLTAGAVGIVGCLLIVYGLVKAVHHYTSPPPVDQGRIEERKKVLAEQRAAEMELLNHYGWVDQRRGLARLPISQAMEFTVREYQNPTATRSNLAALSDKAIAPLPQAAPPPNPFE